MSQRHQAHHHNIILGSLAFWQRIGGCHCGGVDDFTLFFLRSIVFFSRKGPLLRENPFCRRSIIAVTLPDRRRRHSKIIELIQSRPSTNPLFFHSWACLSHSRRSPSFSGARTLVLSPLFSLVPLIFPGLVI